MASIYLSYLEPHPNRVISRCPRTGVFFVNCYGKTIFRQIGSSIISSNGIAFARRDALVLYVSKPFNHIMMLLLDILVD